jgi:two-component system phosphate regulon sensor histidine kinase PhoR
VISLAIAHALVYKEVKRLSDAKTKFLLHASHELRSPANAIESIASTMLKGYLGEITGRQREMIDRIRVRSHVLSAIVSDLHVLTRGRMEQSRFIPKAVSLDLLVEEIVELFESRAREGGIKLSFECASANPKVSGDEDGLRSVITNLLSNAIAYTPKGGYVGVRVDEREDRILLTVRDSGIGIPKEEHDGIFTEFFRASNARAMSEVGTGLGLAIVKANVERYGGTIELESEEGKGTLFRVFLHRAES